MGACTSSPRSKAIKGGRGDFIRRPSTAKVIHMDGRMQELKVPVAAKNITSQNPGHFLCSSESMSINTWVPHVPDEEKLQLGQIYFLLPVSQFHNKPITLKDLCVLAIKASSAIGDHDS
ncbi:hypothetical protein Dsin_010668 [Dipteronia sinensis]|uniref:Uncharacterized protein n=1 Tax=Dipteronia sinensis TaxID=43782 RepID=A0AAE0ECS7_9ROSI|nr:hypothetical protein Dsin_010668 [Dipteronia sinensis]